MKNKGWMNILTNPHARTKGAFKHTVMWDTKIGGWYRKTLMNLAIKMMNTSRKMLRVSCGRCSWCGADCGFSSSMSRKGLRCDNTTCQEKPRI